MMQVREASADDIRKVIMRLRAADKAEQLATRFDDTVAGVIEAVFAFDVMRLSIMCLTCDDGAPAALVGAWLVSPGVATVTQMATPRFPEIARRAHRFYRRLFIPAVLEPTVRLAETKIRAGSPDNLRWVRTLGFEPIGPALPYGKRGEEFFICVWRNRKANSHVQSDVQPRARRRDRHSPPPAPAHAPG
jgi:hypothetical protein